MQVTRVYIHPKTILSLATLALRLTYVVVLLVFRGEFGCNFAAAERALQTAVL
jgi:hypothetical protein